MRATDLLTDELWSTAIADVHAAGARYEWMVRDAALRGLARLAVAP